MSFDEGGMTIWTEGPKPQPGVAIPWNKISDVAIGDPFVPASRFGRAPGFDQLRVTVFDGHHLVEFQFGVETGQSGWMAQTVMAPYHLAELVQRLTDVRERVVRVRRDQPE